MILSRAPFRVPLGGGGTDLPSYYSDHGGFILSAAISKYVYIVVHRPAADQLVRVKYSRSEQVTSWSEVQHDLVKPALEELGIEDNIEIVSLADVPDGTGMGSSSSYLVALLSALYALRRKIVPATALAEHAIHIEMNRAGHPVGKQDHYLAAFGGITCLEIAKNGQVTVTPLHLSLSALEDLRSSIVLFYTGLRRSSSTILEEQRKDTEQKKQEVVESLHRTKELGYCIKKALEQGDIESFGRLLDDHWQNKKRRSGKISDPQIDQWYELARANGALGGKIMGAGGGGFFMFCCRNGHKARLREALAGSGLREMSYDFDFEGCKVLLNV
jgi:D-glycero-alpha-D-manno-heptose-7-phosphate kinase